MLMSKEDLARYAEENRTETEAAADKIFLESFGRTFSDSDMRRAKLQPGEENGSSHPEAALEKIRREFPSLFNADP